MANACTGFAPILISKETNRELREDEKRAIANKEKIDVKPVPKFTADLMYQTYGKRTGTTISELIDKANEGNTPVVIINDIMAMSKLKRECKLRDPDICVISFFLFRRIPVRSEFFEESKKRGNVPDEETEQRYDKAKTLYRIYIENMYVFDYVILNAITYSEEEIENDEIINNSIIDKQIRAIRDNIILKGMRPFERENCNKPPLYVITGNAASGKDELIRATIDLGKLYAEAVPKYTSRNQGSDDGSEMICRYIIDEREVSNFEKKAEQLKQEIIATLTEINKLNVKYKEWLNYDDVDAKKNKIEKNVLYDVGVKTFLWWELLDNAEKKELDIQEFFPWAHKTDIKPVGYIENPKYVELQNLLDTLKTEEIGSRFISYKANNNQFDYYIDLETIREGLARNKAQVIVLSNWNSIDKLKQEFGEQVIVVFCHSQINEEEFLKKAKGTGTIAKIGNFRQQLHDYVERFCDYRHVIIYAERELGRAIDGRQEELIDQLFRLFCAYEQKWL